MQEFNTAANAVLQVLPNAKINQIGKDDYPIYVIIKSDDDGKVIWEGDQRKLFRKYPKDRENSISEIISAMEKKYANILKQ